MRKTLLTLTLAVTSLMGFSQTYIHHSADDCILLNITPQANLDDPDVIPDATYTASVLNPDATNPVANPNTSTNVSSTLSGTANNNLIIDLPTTYAVGDPFTFNFRFYSASSGSNKNGSGRIIVRMYNSNLGTSATKRINLTNVDKTGGKWEEYSYTTTSLPDNTASESDIADGIDAAGGYDKIIIIPSNGAETIETLYFDDIELNIDNSVTPLSSDATLATDNQWYYNNAPDAFNTTAAGWAGAADPVESQATPSTIGNSKTTVLKFTRNDNDATTGIKFDQGPSFKYDEGDGRITVRIYPECNIDYGIPSVKIRARHDGTSGTQIQTDGVTNLTPNQWNEVSLDLTDVGNQSGSIATNGVYNEVYLIFNQGINIDTSGNLAVFYVDALQVPKEIALSTNDIDAQAAAISVYPNPVTNSFQLDYNKNIENVELYNVTGRLLKTFSARANYDISDLTMGIYLVNINTTSGSKTLKIVKK
ncbi:T9SS type A sorting domain-containing protein [Algibacter miyuki]|uniref:T9SS type A sorting domain-containing protein n=1 Tax=Algibacter miyuki TaxID=1306933 RepID=A0ABV5H2W2_9FLAO|nr:T9SS type A sorting domain-containing protein [Algibacter miyuki]MDN3663921.1 T9SS type A sorting domain-containing protein [Algibacter miyuki]